MVEKVPVKNDHFNETEMEIRKSLTDFAANHICGEYKESKKNIYTLRKRSTVITTTENSCSCGFYSSMGLQCRHIMAVRKEKNLPIYVSSLSRLRWTRPYYLAAHPAFKDTNKQGCFHVAPKQKLNAKNIVK